jgi:hypothetical protein
MPIIPAAGVIFYRAKSIAETYPVALARGFNRTVLIAARISTMAA